jgi:hypothetical protein
MTCPHPIEPYDCPLYAHRVSLADSEAIRRLILTERSRTPDLADLIRAERRQADPPQAALPSGPSPGASSILDQLKEKADAESTRTSH